MNQEETERDQMPLVVEFAVNFNNHQDLLKTVEAFKNKVSSGKHKSPLASLNLLMTYYRLVFIHLNAEKFDNVDVHADIATSFERRA